MKMVEGIGKSVDEAIANALQELGVNREEVEIEVLEEPSKGFLGLLGGRNARVKVIMCENPNRELSSFLNSLMNKLGVEAAIKIEKEGEGNFLIDLRSDKPGILIGRRGETLESLQYLINLAVNRNLENKVRVTLDVEDYRQRREEALVKLAKRVAERVKASGYRVVLQPMNPRERRIIHTVLQDESGVVTFSEGREPYRKVVVSQKK